MLVTIVNILVIIVLVLYITKRWNEAKEKRDAHDSLRISTGVNTNEKKSSTVTNWLGAIVIINLMLKKKKKLFISNSISH